ncbi:MAG: ATP-binding protein [Patescibacteria group bacterium]
MHRIKRHLDSVIQSHFDRHKGQTLLLLGARQVGKTTLLKRIFPTAQYLLLDNDPVRKNFETYDINTYRQFINPTDTVIIDEIQLLPDPGRAAKIIHDQMPQVKLIVTGSSALHIKNRSSESLAGRKIDYHLFPFTFAEYLYQIGIEEHLSDEFFSRLMSGHLNPRAHLFDLRATLSRILTVGLSPYLIDHPNNVEYLKELATSAIFKDILELDLIEDRRMAADLLRLLAYQIGNLINYSELASRLGADRRTVMRYISIFEQSFILFRLTPFTGNRRDEIGKAPKIYFFDVGLRNAIINDFSDPFLRRDFGALFENFIISEVYKHNAYSDNECQMAFWRTTQGAEIDLILRHGEQLIACEIKGTQRRVPVAFRNRYPHAQMLMMTPENFY